MNLLADRSPNSLRQPESVSIFAYQVKIIMRLIAGLNRIPPFPSGTTATIGNFDGVHLGHQAVLNGLVERATNAGMPAVVVLFEPQPREFFDRAEAPARLTRLREKLTCLRQLALEYVVLLRFDRQLATCPAQKFVEELLVRRLNLKHLLIGDDFRFGAERRGDFEFLQEAGAKFGFTVEDTATIQLTGERISSTGIRDALEVGDLATAEAMLGRVYSLCGRVTAGDGRGHELGFPTANIRLNRASVPLRGVFAVTMRVASDSERLLTGVANVGFRPTFGDKPAPILEVHLFDFDRDLYGKRVEVFFHRKLREEQRFPSAAALTQQIAADIAAARSALSLFSPLPSSTRVHGLQSND